MIKYETRINNYLNYFTKYFQKKPIIFDIGAHEGHSVKFYSNTIKNNFLYAFEADPRVFNTLSENIKNKKNIKIENIALAEVKKIKNSIE